MALPKKKTTTSAKKSSSEKKKSSAKKSAPALKKVVFPPVKEVLPEQKTHTLSSKADVKTDTTIFTTLLAIFIVAFVVFGGYIYSREMQRRHPIAHDTISTNRSISRPIDVSPSVTLTPEISNILAVLPSLLYIEPDDILQNAGIISDISPLQARNWDFFKNAQVGDYLLRFKERSVIFRPLNNIVVNVGAEGGDVE